MADGSHPTDSPSRIPRTVPAKHALAWFAEAMRLWKRSPVVFCVQALVILLVTVTFEPVPVLGFVAANVIAPGAPPPPADVRAKKSTSLTPRRS